MTRTRGSIQHSDEFPYGVRKHPKVTNKVKPVAPSALAEHVAGGEQQRQYHRARFQKTVRIRSLAGEPVLSEPHKKHVGVKFFIALKEEEGTAGPLFESGGHRFQLEPVDDYPGRAEEVEVSTGVHSRARAGGAWRPAPPRPAGAAHAPARPALLHPTPARRSLAVLG